MASLMAGPMLTRDQALANGMLLGADVVYWCLREYKVLVDLETAVMMMRDAGWVRNGRIDRPE